jgi:biuret amidohydrolase
MLSIATSGNRTFECDPKHTALVIIDMQRDFVEDGGACGVLGANVKLAQAIIPNVASLLGFAREMGLCVAHTRYGFKRDLSNLAESVRRQSKEAGGEYGTQGPLGLMYVEGEPGFEIIPQLSPRPGEIVVNKPTFGAFVGSDLHAQLDRRGITHLIFCGVTTQCCVESSVREALDLGYFIMTVEDGCAAFEQDLHDATMRAISSEGHLFGWTTSAASVLASRRAAA